MVTGWRAGVAKSDSRPDLFMDLFLLQIGRPGIAMDHMRTVGIFASLDAAKSVEPAVREHWLKSYKPNLWYLPEGSIIGFIYQYTLNEITKAD